MNERGDEMELDNSNMDLIKNLDDIHTTDLGAERIRKNLSVECCDLISWCKDKVKSSDSIIRKGKNWYVHVDDCILTINAHSFTIITAHKVKINSKP